MEKIFTKTGVASVRSLVFNGLPACSLVLAFI